MDYPKDRHYVASHEWVKIDGDELVVGITEAAQDMLGDIVFVGDYTLEERVEPTTPIATIESVKAASDIYAPVAGVVVMTNPVLEDAPEQINEKPFDTWILRIKPNNIADVDQLLSAEDYVAQLD